MDHSNTSSTHSLKNNINIDSLIEKLKKLKTPECSKGDLHEQLNQICIDPDFHKNIN